jgi:hypothetical protein
MALILKRGSRRGLVLPRPEHVAGYECGGEEAAKALCLLKTSSAAEILVITDPNADRNKIEI